MTERKRNPFRLSRLREIGWKLWDPIGLLEEGDTHPDEEFADEYDCYLLRAAGLIANGEGNTAVAKYLEGIESSHIRMAGSDRDERRARRVRVAEALRRYVEEELPAQPARQPKTVIL